MIYLGAPLLFTLGVWVFAGSGPALEFITGFLTEKALSVDNLFVFALVLSAFAVPHRHQPKVLLIGILAALGMQAVLITADAELVQRFSIVFLGFGTLLIYTAIRLLRTHGPPPEIANTRIMCWARQLLPIAEHTTSPQDSALLVHRHGKPAVTRLGLAVLALLAADVIFALDSVPAIVGITENLYLVPTTHAFALPGLRAVLAARWLAQPADPHLHYGLALILGLIGTKLTLHHLHTLTPTVPEIPTWLSLTRSRRSSPSPSPSAACAASATPRRLNVPTEAARLKPRRRRTRHHPPVDNMLPMRCFWRRTVGSRNLWPILCRQYDTRAGANAIRGGQGSDTFCPLPSLVCLGLLEHLEATRYCKTKGNDHGRIYRPTY